MSRPPGEGPVASQPIEHIGQGGRSEGEFLHRHRKAQGSKEGVRVFGMTLKLRWSPA